MKNNKKLNRAATFASGMAAMALLVVMIGPAFATENQFQIAYNQIGVRVFEQQKISAGETYTAPNGQQVPSSITYTDAVGGQTNYLSIRQISELLDAEIEWNASINSVDIAAFNNSGGADVSLGTDSGFSSMPVKPEYGRVVGVFEEVDPETVSGLKDPEVHPIMYMKDTRVQYQFFGFPEVTANMSPVQGRYIVYTVTNNGDKDQYTTVGHKITISNGTRESFQSVVVKPGETLVRAFRLAENADPLQSVLCFGIGGDMDPKVPTDVTVSLEQYP